MLVLEPVLGCVSVLVLQSGSVSELESQYELALVQLSGFVSELVQVPEYESVSE